MNVVERAGNLLIIIGAAALAGAFAIVLANGAWPEFLRPLQNYFAFLGNLIGDAAIVVEGLTFVGPGLLVREAGRRIASNNVRRESKPA